MNDIEHLSPAERRALLAQLLEKRERRTRSYPLSFAQQRLWFFEQFEPGSALYILSGQVRLAFALNLTALEQSINEIVRRHEALRTTFTSVEGRPTQVVSPSLTIPMPIIDLSGLSGLSGLRGSPQRDAEVARLAQEETRRPFDLAHGPLLRTTLLRVADADYIMLLSMHHIISDGWSIGVFFKELGALYQAFYYGQPSPLPALPIQYPEFAERQRRDLDGEALARLLAHWKGRLAGVPELLALPTDRPRPAAQSYRGAMYQFALPGALRNGVKALCRREGATLFMGLLSGFAALLYRYTGQRDIVVGSPIANRTRAELEGLIGFFVNTLLLRCDLSNAHSFRSLVARVKDMTLDAYSYQELPFEKLVEELHPERSLSFHPLFQVVFGLQNTPGAPAGAASPEAEQAPPAMTTGTSKFDLTLLMAEAQDGLTGMFEYSTDLFDPATIERMAGHLGNLLAAAVADPDRSLDELPLLGDAERRQLLTGWNTTRIERPRTLVQELFQAQARRTPEAIAVASDDASLTSRELNRRANQIAHRLQELGVGPGVRVGLCMDRSPDMVVGLMGILKAGGAYVPMDPAYPTDRLAYMLDDAQAAVLLTQERWASQLPSHRATVVCVDADAASIAAMPEHDPESRARPEDLAYMIYTSGSTGRPKGTMINGRSFLNLTLWYQAHCPVTAETRSLLMIPIGFDASLKNIVTPLIAGGAVILSRTESYDAPALLEVIRAQQVTLINCTPSLIYPIVEQAAKDGYRALSSLRHLALGGEPMALERLRPWLLSASCRCQLSNVYGPTECTDVSSAHVATRQEIGALESLPIGKPVANARLYIVNERQQLQPIGIPGELCIAGEGVGEGYLNKPELTSQRFVADPFQPGSRMYRTGDLARWSAAGTVEFLGRTDQQVKVRGIRIELGEIEAVLRQHPGVREAVVVVYERQPGDKRLAAYIVAGARPPDAGELRGFLKSKLPDHMIPASFTPLDALPLSPNGKVDPRRLPAPDDPRASDDEGLVAPRTPVEEVLVGIWAEVLGVERFGVHEDFFDLGGHSLLATQVVSRVRDTFQVELPLRSLFEGPTVAQMATSILRDPEQRAAVEQRAKVVIDLARMSDDQVEHMLGNVAPGAHASEGK